MTILLDSLGVSMTFDVRALQELVTFMLPFMSTDHERTSLYTLAFGPDHPLLYQLSFNGSPQAALTALIQKTLTFGEIRPGVPALWALLEVLRQQVGLDKQVQIDRFRALLGLPPIALPDRVFVSYSRKNEAFARRVELDLQDAGLKVWFDRFKIRGGDEWRQAIQRGIDRADFVVFCLSPDSMASEVCHWELNTAQQSGKLIIPIMLMDCLPLLSEDVQHPIAWLRERHILDLTHADEYGRRFKELLAALPGYNPPDGYYEDTLDTRQIPNPFRGLEAFRELDYHYFAGRESAVADLVQRVQDPTKPHLLAVVGASGSGKSSLVRAGLLPTLRDVPHLQWETAVFKPGSQPLRALAERLELRFGQPASELHKTFLQSSSSLNDRVQSTLSGQSNESRFLLVVDQCEEIFAPAAEQERQAFLDVLLAAVTQSRGSIHVLLTLRADFFSYLSAYPTLASLIEENLFITTTMTTEQLRRCIEIPAQKVGLIYEAGVVEQILDAVREQPGALPLLQYALKELYERRHGRFLTTQAYSDMGGVQGALATRAETIFSQLSEEQKRVMRRLLLQLVEVGDEAVTRRRVRLSSLQLQGITSEDVQAVADVLTAEHARLLVASAPISDDNLDNDAEIDLEVSHEALLTHWHRLAGWITDDRDDLRRGSEYLQLAQAWHVAGRSETSYLLTGARLATAQDWLTRADATHLQRDFIEASAAYQAQEIARLERLTREAKDATQASEAASKQAIRNRTIAFITGIAAFIFAAGASLIGANAVTEANKAATQVADANSALTAVPPTLTRVAEIVQQGEDRIESQRLAALAQGALNEAVGNPEIAALLSIRALKTSYSEQANASLMEATDSLFIKNRFTGHTSYVYSVAFASDGKTALSGSEDDTLILWDIASGKSLHTYRGHAERITSVAFAPDGKTILSGSRDDTLILWDIATEKPLHTFRGHTDNVTSVAFAPDGKTILSGSEDDHLILWDIASGRQIHIFKGNEYGFVSVAFAPDGKTALGSSGVNTLTLWDIASGQSIRTFSELGHTSYITSVAFAPDGKTAVSGSDDKTLILWDIASGQSIRTFSGHTREVTSVAFSPGGKTVLSGSWDNTLILWDIYSQQPLRTFTGHTGVVTSVAFAPDGKTVLSGSSDNTLILWTSVDNTLPVNMLTDQPLRIFAGYTSSINSVAFSPDGKTALSGSDNNNALILWDIAIGRPLHTFTDYGVTSVVFSPDGKTALSNGYDDMFVLLDIATGQILRTFTGYDVSRLVFSPDGKTVLSGSYNGILILWDIATGQPLRTFNGYTSSVNSVAFAPDGKTALSGSDDGALILWNIATGLPIHTFTAHVDAVQSVAFAPDGKTALSGASGNNNALILWDITTVLPIHTFDTSYVYSVAFSPDGKTALSGSIDNTISLWDITIDQPLHIFRGHTDIVTSVAFSPDGKTILSGSSDGTLRLWDTNYRDFIAYACTRVFRDLNEDERNLYEISDSEPTCPQFATEDHPILIPFPPTSTGMPTAAIPVWTPIASSTPTPTLTMIPTETPTSTPASAGAAHIGENRGDLSLGGSQTWTYAGQAGESVAVTVLADHPAGVQTSREQRVEGGLLDAFLIVHGPDNFQLENDDDKTVSEDAAERTNSRLDITLPADGIYDIEVRSFANQSNGAYTLIIESAATLTATPTLTPSHTPTATPLPTLTSSS